MLNNQNDTIMKKMFFALMVMLTTTMTASAMSYEQARSEALFLTDKMAYELNLTDEQYEAAYEINLDYLMGVTGRADVFGTYWERRNLDLSYILLDWQWNAYIAASYFYRPLYWDAGYWHFGVYRRYPHRDYFFFGRPHFYATYRGGHAWHVHGGHGYYYGHREHFRSSPREHFGMHDRWNRGDFRGPGHSSTRVTAGPGRGGNYGSSRPTNPGNGTVNRRPGNSFGGSYGGSSSGNSNVNRMSAHRYGSSHMSNGRVEASQADRPTQAVEAPSQAEPAQEVPTQVVSLEAHILEASLVVHTLVAAHTVEVHTVVDHMVVAEVTSEATDKKGYSSSVRTSAFDIL